MSDTHAHWHLSGCERGKVGPGSWLWDTSCDTSTSAGPRVSQGRVHVLDCVCDLSAAQPLPGCSISPCCSLTWPPSLPSQSCHMVVLARPLALPSTVLPPWSPRASRHMGCLVALLSVVLTPACGPPACGSPSDKPVPTTSPYSEYQPGFISFQQLPQGPLFKFFSASQAWFIPPLTRRDTHEAAQCCPQQTVQRRCRMNGGIVAFEGAPTHLKGIQSTGRRPGLAKCFFFGETLSTEEQTARQCTVDEMQRQKCLAGGGRASRLALFCSGVDGLSRAAASVRAAGPAPVSPTIHITHLFLAKMPCLEVGCTLRAIN